MWKTRAKEMAEDIPAILAKIHQIIVALAKGVIPYAILFCKGIHSSIFRKGYTKKQFLRHPFNILYYPAVTINRGSVKLH